MTLSGVDLVAKAKKTGKPSKTADDRAVIIHLKGTSGYAAWLDDIHKKTHLPKATIIRLALTLWAKENDHPEPPEF